MAKKRKDRRAPKGEDVRLTENENKSLGKKSNLIKVKKGKAWVSSKGEDHIVEEGDIIKVKSDKHSGLISPAGKDSMIFEVADEENDDSDTTE